VILNGAYRKYSGHRVYLVGAAQIEPKAAVCHRETSASRDAERKRLRTTERMIAAEAGHKDPVKSRASWLARYKLVGYNLTRSLRGTSWHGRGGR
jgi:hypothetical protein